MSDTYFIYGMHAVQATLEKEPQNITRIWLEQSRRDQRGSAVMGLAKQNGIHVVRVKRDELDKLVPEASHQGVVAESKAKAALNEAGLNQLLDNLAEPPLLLILDGVTDPHNLGACLRTADAAGVHALIVPRDKACGLTAVVRKVASGAAETVPFVQVTNLARTLKALKQRNIWLVGTDLDTEQDIYEADLSGPLALVMGAEGKGMRRLTREQCDFLVKLPMRGSVQSLNVSVSTGICLYEAVRQRGR
ncbi:MAG: 23S rRNA (guanosine(2251)-2'-O)-methyltransferase RlmB [Gammaproteobacteria bacterium]